MIHTADHDLLMRRSAILSDDGVFRYVLTRTWSQAGQVLFIMLNPSTADATKDDATIRRCVGFATDWEKGGIVVVNLFAYRATQPADLKRAFRKGVSVVGPENDVHIRTAAREADLVICAWGGHGALSGRGAFVRTMLRDAKKDLMCLGVTQEGHPRHPLFVERGQKPILMEAV